jgi:putative IMPACT (imprinted ancient) family translation regulator
MANRTIQRASPCSTRYSIPESVRSWPCCTRYYRGVKLGTGGLSRAYSSGVNLALDGLPTEPKIVRVPVEIVIGYETVTEFHRIMMEVVVEAEG